MFYSVFVFCQISLVCFVRTNCVFTFRETSGNTIPPLLHLLFCWVLSIIIIIQVEYFYNFFLLQIASFSGLIDGVLRTSDLNNDGYLNYIEFNHARVVQKSKIQERPAAHKDVKK